MNRNYVLALFIACFILFSGKSFAQVTITAASGGNSICVGGSSVTLGALTIKETANGDIPNGGQTYTFNVPANFEFDNTATLTYGGTTGAITGMATPTFNNTTLTVTFNVAGTAGQNDQLVINGIKVRAITAPSFGNIISNTNSLGVSNTTNHATLFSISPPVTSMSDDDANNVICTGQTITFTGYGASTYEFFVDGVSVQGPGAATTYSTSSLTTPSHTIRVTGTTGTCSSQSANTVITVNATPTFSSWTPTDQSFALSDPDNDLGAGAFTVAPGGGTMVFSGNGVSSSGANHRFSPSAAGAGSHSISASYVVGGCTTNVINKTFVVNSAGNVTGLNATYCINGGGSFINITPPAGKTLSKFQYYCYNCGYIWVDIPAPNNYFNPAVIAASAGVGYAYVQALYTDGTVSPYTDTYIYDKPSLFIYSTGPYCQNNGNINLSFYPPDNGNISTNFTGVGVSESAPNSGIWRFNTAVGNSTVTYNFKSNGADGCTNSVSQAITVNPPPTVDIPVGTFSAGGYCTNSATFGINGSPAGGTFSGPGTTLTSYTYTGIPPYYYLYSYSYSPSSVSPGTYKIYYNYTDANYCSGVDSVAVTTYAAPSVTTTVSGSDTTLCLPLVGNGTYKFSSKVSGATGVTWSSSVDGGSTYTTGGPNGTFAGTGGPAPGYTFAEDFTNSAFQNAASRALIRVSTTGQPVTCPVGTKDFTAYLIPPPTVQITGLVKDRYCKDEPNFTLQGTATYKSVLSSLGIVYTSNGAVSNFAPVTPPDAALAGSVFQPFSAATGNHDIRYSFTDPNGCTGTNDTTIIINANPVADFVIDSGRCATRFTYFSAAPSTIPPSTTVTYSWDFGDGTTLADTSHVQKPQYKYPSAGGYPVSLTLKTNQGCSNTKTLPNNNLLIIQTIPKSDFDFRFQCFGDLTLFDTLSILQPGTFKSRTWLFAYTKTGAPFFQIYQTGSVATSYSFPKPGNYFVTVIDSTTLGCTDKSKKPVFILPYIVPTVTNPYAISFKDSTGNWGQNGIKSTWVHDIPNPAVKPLMYYGGAGITDSVWVTSDTTASNMGLYNAGEKSHIHSPCINFSQLDKPMISIRLWTATQEQIAGAVLNASTDNGTTWSTIGKLGDGIEWYNNIGIAGSPGNLTTNDGWSGIDTTWKQARIGLPGFANYNPAQKVRLKITFGAPSDSTIARSEGIAIDSVWIGNKNKVVLLEHFTNNAASGTSIPAITSANTNVKNIRDSRPKDVAMLYYHSSAPDADPFNIAYPEGPSARVLYYGVPSAPRSVLDGNYYYGNIYSGSTPDARLDVKDVDSRSLETAIYQFDLTSNFTPGLATIATKLTYIGVNPDSNDVVLHTVIVEDDTTGAVKYPAIVRRMLPDAAGSYISKTWSYGDSLTFTNTWSHSLPGTAVLGVVTFVQNVNTKEIYQAAFLRGNGTYGSPVVAGVETVASEEDFKVHMFPNPATDDVFFLYGKALKEDSEWSVYDQMGRIVEQGICSQGKEGFSINTSNYAGGLYHVKLHGANGAVDFKELVVIH